MRKIRCDTKTDACSNCLDVGIFCYITDRTSGRTQRRGYTRELECIKAALEALIAYLETELAENNIPFDAYEGPNSLPTSPKEADGSRNEEHTVVDVTCRSKTREDTNDSVHLTAQPPTAMIADTYQHFVPPIGSTSPNIISMQ